MHRWNWLHGSLVLGLMLITGAAIRADRVPSQKVEIPRAPVRRSPSSPCR